MRAGMARHTAKRAYDLHAYKAWEQEGEKDDEEEEDEEDEKEKEKDEEEEEVVEEVKEDEEEEEQSRGCTCRAGNNSVRGGDHRVNSGLVADLRVGSIQRDSRDRRHRAPRLGQGTGRGGRPAASGATAAAVVAVSMHSAREEAVTRAGPAVSVRG